MLRRLSQTLLQESKNGCSRYTQLLSLANFAMTAQAGSSGLKDKLTIVPMPQLSPTMTKGRVSKWLKQPGEEIATYDVVFEVETESLSEDAYKIGDFAGTVTMLVEAQEDGFLSKVLVGEGKDVDVHTPVATMCEYEETLEQLSQGDAEVQQLLKDHGQLRKLTWQSYLKEAKEGQKGCS